MSSAYEILEAARDLSDKLFEIADDLDNAHTVASGVKLLGKVGALAGFGLGIAASVVTGGLAAPLVAAGGIAAVAGSATSVGADVIEKLVAKEKLKKTQSELERFRSKLRNFRDAYRGAASAIQASSALRGFIQSSGSALSLARVLPVLDKIFLVLDVMDILEILFGENKSDPAEEVRKLARNLRDLEA